MNSPFHRAAVKAFEDVYVEMVEMLPIELADLVGNREFRREFASKLEAQAKAFDACKSGTQISMQALHHEMTKALAAYRKRMKVDGDFLAAERAFFDHMKPHFEIRLW